MCYIYVYVYYYLNEYRQKKSSLERNIFSDRLGINVLYREGPPTMLGRNWRLIAREASQRPQTELSSFSRLPFSFPPRVLLFSLDPLRSSASCLYKPASASTSPSRPALPSSSSSPPSLLAPARARHRRRATYSSFSSSYWSTQFILIHSLAVPSGILHAS